MYKLNLLLLSSALIYCVADTCHQFQDRRETPNSYHNDIFSSYILNANYYVNNYILYVYSFKNAESVYTDEGFCKIVHSDGDVCCSYNSIANYNKYIDLIKSYDIITGLNCRNISRNLMCHYGCSPNHNVNRLQPQFSRYYIQQFMTECRNNIWCGIQNGTQSNSGCYIVRNGKIKINYNIHEISLTLSIAEFANKILDVGIVKTRYSDPPDVDTNSNLIIQLKNNKIAPQSIFDYVCYFIMAVFHIVEVIVLFLIYILIEFLASLILGRI